MVSPTYVTLATSIELANCVYILAQSLEKIIQRDFFPDVTKLQAQKDYLEAEECGDLEKMREISIRYGSSMAKSTPRSTAPCTFTYDK